MIPVLWVVTVAGASTLTWSVISAAGAQVSQPVTVSTANATQTPTAVDTSTPQPADAVRTSTGRGGRVTARCADDGSVSLRTAVPDDGYWVKLYNPGPVTLRVDFEVVGDDEDDDEGSEPTEVKVEATCVDGTPVFKRS